MAAAVVSCKKIKQLNESNPDRPDSCSAVLDYSVDSPTHADPGSIFGGTCHDVGAQDLGVGAAVSDLTAVRTHECVLANGSKGTHGSDSRV